MEKLKVAKVERVSPVLNQPDFGCLRGIPSINITRGCMHSCVYCYARGFPDAPPKGEVYIYSNVLSLLEHELQRKKRLPQWVSFSTASDAFQAINEVLDLTFKIMNLLLEMGIGISFLTKGYIPREFIHLFKKKPSLVRARIGIVSLNEEYWRVFEPRTAHPQKRLKNIRNLIDAGIDVGVRIDPIIPFYSFNEKFPHESIEHLIKRLHASGVREISISHLVMRPSIMNQMMDELPFKDAKRIISLYKGQPWQRVITSAKTRLFPQEMRTKQIRIFKDIAERYNIKCHACGCKNPDLKWEPCHPWIKNDRALSPLSRQLTLSF